MNFYILFAIVATLAILKIIFENYHLKYSAKPKYKYTRKQFFLTRSERECYNMLVKAVGDEYCIFAQVHLGSILDEKVRGQNWRAARAHIDRKSVDFLLCDKAYLSPKLAIELDDKTHERPDRQERDKIVERIFSETGLPLLRLENIQTLNAEDLKMKIIGVLGDQNHDQNKQ